ncbi:hypothetical protein N7321_03980 [Comamonas aquatica]|uniref:hypothetical protein n=1 Tax=Comamonas aquatica TaxID=225991 RepID=UPI0024468F18|nr:hypothetical protein [Comamonas aquatica]MDH0428927.1 hypothetical protein [Comamonas aquatica]
MTTAAAQHPWRSLPVPPPTRAVRTARPPPNANHHVAPPCDGHPTTRPKGLQ